MENYLNTIVAIILTVVAIALIGLVVAGGYMIYKFIKEEF